MHNTVSPVTLTASPPVLFDLSLSPLSSFFVPAFLKELLSHYQFDPFLLFSLEILNEMSSTPKKRLKSNHRNPNPPSSSSSLLFEFLSKEPPPNILPSNQKDLLKLLVVVVIAITVSISCNYMVSILNRQPKPFCDSDGAFEDSLTDICEPCPSNGECYKGDLECVRGYRNQGRLCVEDGEINQTAKKLSEWVERRVCEACVGVLCDNIGKVWVQEAEMLKELDRPELREQFGLKNSSFMYTKQKAMEMVESSLEIQQDTHGIKELKCPDWLVERYKPLPCYIRHWVTKHAFILVSISVLLTGSISLFISLLRRVRLRRYLSNRSEQLYQQICEILEEKAIMAKSVNADGEPWVVASWLRDHLLLPRERKDPLLWKKVEELLQEDSRLDQYPKLVKGESKVVWEWQVEGSLSSSRAKMKGQQASKLIPSESIQYSPAHQQQQQQTPKARKLLSFI